MRNPNNEFHLEARGESRWQLTPVAFSPRFLHRPVPAETQPAAAAPWEVENRFGEQSLRFVLRVAVDKAGAEDGYIANPTFVVGEQAVTFPTRVAPRQYLVCEGDGQGQLYSDDWKPLATVKPIAAAPTLQAGHRQIRFRCETTGGLRPRVEIRFKTVGSPEPVG
jgi:hypothetical protein